MIYRFEKFALDDERLELRRGNRVVEVQPKVLDLLLHLIREREHVVSRRELLDHLWGDAAVVESVLTTAIHEARVALGDNASRQWAVKTVPRRGYRFVARIEEGPASEAAPAPRSSPDPWTRDVFVGREDSLRRLQSALDAARAGRGRSLVVAGESGIGKTRLIEELASRAEAGGAQVLTGWCYEGEGSPPYWPWSQLLRCAIPEEHPDEALIDMGAGAADLATLVPVLHELRPDLPEPVRIQSGKSRFHLFESIATFLANAAKRRPLLILVDDLNWADHASLRLLGFLAREVRRARILVVATVREGEGGAHPVLEETLAELARQSPGDRIRLEGLHPDETRQLIAGLTGQEPSPGLVRAIVERGEGNPFFVKEMLSLLHAQGGLEEDEAWTSAVPPGVRDVILRRLHRSSPTCQRVLALGAVLGRDFRWELLERVADLGSQELSAALDEARAAGFLHEHPTQAGHYRFAHALTRETLYAEWNATERASWHLRTGEELEALTASDPTAPQAELAHHFLKAAPGGVAEKAVDYAVRAAEHAVTVHAHDEAVKHYGRALEALDLLEMPDDAQRCELLIALGTAQLDAQHSDPRGRESLLRAAEIARTLGRPDQLARAALELAGTAHHAGPGDPIVIELLEEALARLEGGDEALKARVMADLAIQRLSAESLDEGAALSEQAVLLAQKTGDAVTLGETLNLRLVFLSGPQHVRERLGQADLLLDLASEAGSADLAMFGHRWRLVSMLELGEIEAADRELEAYERAAGAARAWAARWYASTFRAMRALFEGRLADAERLAFEAFSQRRHEPSPLILYTFGAQLLWLRREQGRLGEIEPYVQEHPLDSRFPLVAAFRATRTLLDAERGSLDAARLELERLASDRLAELPRDFTFLYSVAVLCELCAAVGDAASAAILYDALRPFADRNVVLFVGTLCLGSASRYLGLAAATMGELERAETHFAEALQANERMAARPWVAHTRFDWAKMLRARGGAEDATRAVEILRPGLDSARELGLTALEQKSGALARELRAATPGL